ncbi:MAG: glycosyltransferase family 2 protein [Bacteroidia bacterium]|jgi:glycosyltransferase involved in cell wall biosynthesis|nr:glycosyltransferase family 2 protein [Bacteroidia bacterium]
MLDVSLVVPLYNEEESLPELCAWIKRVCDAEKLQYEIILLDDGSTDKSWEVIEELGKTQKEIKGIQLRRNYGKSGALNVGFQEAQGEVIITMDADLQDSPDEIPALLDMILKENYQVVSGWKKKRYDPISKTIPTKLFNWATRKMSGIELNDFNCGLKAYHHEVVKNIEVYGEMHRYIPVLAKWGGFPRIGEKVVEHQARKYGSSKFGMDRFINGFLDLLSLYFMSKFGKRPMHFFGLYGVLSFLMGTILAFIIIGNKLYYTYWLHQRAPLVTDSPLFYLGLLAMIIGTQLFLAGFLGELVSRNSADRNDYSIKSRVN